MGPISRAGRNGPRLFQGGVRVTQNKASSQPPDRNAVSTIHHVTAKMAPTLIYHGEADTTVPIYQSQMLAKKCVEVGATFKLIPKPGAAHGGQFGNHLPELAGCADWFDTYLLGKKK